MSKIVGAGVSQFHDDKNEFELLLAFEDGREIGHSVSRKVARDIASELIGAAAPDLLETLRECEEYFDNRADAEYFPDSAAPVPNKEMTLLTAIREAIGKAGS